jgi:hypothetical protein
MKGSSSQAKKLAMAILKFACDFFDSKATKAAGFVADGDWDLAKA